jgi:hypothetical protein
LFDGSRFRVAEDGSYTPLKGLSEFTQEMAAAAAAEAGPAGVVPSLVDVDSDAVPEGGPEAVLAWVGVDAERAARALDAEAGRGPRPVLAAALQELAAGVDQVLATDQPGADRAAADADRVPDGNADAVRDWVAGDADRARRALEVEVTRKPPRSVLLGQLERLAAGGSA